MVFLSGHVTPYPASHFIIGCLIKKRIRLINFVVILFSNPFLSQVFFVFLPSLFFLLQTSYRQAEEEFQKASRQVAALEEETVKALTGESQLDLSVVNGMLLKHRAKLEECQRTMEEAKAKKKAEAENNKAAQAQVKEMLTWVERYDKATVEAKHMIIAVLVDRIEIGENYEVHIQFKVSAEQFIQRTA
jgi:hypothetical protein